MQVKAASIWVTNPQGESIEYTDVPVLLSDWGVYIKGDDTLTLITWEKVTEIKWTDMKTIERVWAEAVLDSLEDMMDELDFEDEVEEEVPAKADDPTDNPYDN